MSHFEEPVPYWELEQTKQVSEALDIAVTGGEQDCDLSIWRAIIGQRVVDIAQPEETFELRITGKIGAVNIFQPDQIGDGAHQSMQVYPLGLQRQLYPAPLTDVEPDTQ